MKRELFFHRIILRDKVMKIMLLTGFLALGAATVEGYINANLHRVLAIYAPVYFITLLVNSLPKVPSPLKGLTIVLFLFILGVSELYLFGIKSQAPILLISAILLALLLHNTLTSLIFLGLSLGAILFLAPRQLRIKQSLSPLELAHLISLEKWISSSLIFLMLTTSLVLVLHITLAYLGRSMARNDRIAQDLKKEKEALIKANADLSRTAYTDQITGLPNNRCFEKDREALFNNSQKPAFLHLILVEITDFNDFNIRYGIMAANELLMNAGKRLAGLPQCRVYRETGARFLIMCETGKRTERPDCSGDLHEKLVRSFSVKGEEIGIRYRAAVMSYPEDTDRPEKMAATLMMTLNESPKSRDNTIIPYNRDNIFAIVRRNRMKELLKESLGKKEIFTHIQPRLETSSGKISGGELLIRWNSPELGSISPEEFIPLAEQEGLIFELTLFVLDSLDHMAESDFRINMVEQPTFSINISPTLLHTRQMAGLLENLETKSHWANIEFELTEGVFLKKSDSVLKHIGNLHNRKIGISIDDFGTGYSNLEYLQDLDADILKIDKRFITGVPHKRKEKNLTQAIINIARALDLHIVAEGVEYEEQYKWLKNREVQEIQGYLLCRPIGFTDYVEFVKHHDPARWD